MGFAVLPDRSYQSLAVSTVGGVGSGLSILSQMEMVGPVRGGRWSPKVTLRKREPPDQQAMLYNVFVTDSLMLEIVGQRVGICPRISDVGE